MSEAYTWNKLADIATKEGIPTTKQGKTKEVKRTKKELFDDIQKKKKEKISEGVEEKEETVTEVEEVYTDKFLIAVGVNIDKNPKFDLFGPYDKDKASKVKKKFPKLDNYLYKIVPYKRKYYYLVVEGKEKNNIVEYSDQSPVDVIVSDFQYSKYFVSKKSYAYISPANNCIDIFEPKSEKIKIINHY